MSIQEICELSSILESDDREKAELQKKNLTILGSIKQQESRLQHELDEKSKFVLSLYRLDGRYQDFAADIEMTMLSISELAESRQKIENSGIILKTDNYVQKKEELVRRVNSLHSDFNELDTSLGDIESRYAILTDSNPMKLIKENFNTHDEEKNRAAQQLHEAQTKLGIVENRLAQELHSIEDSKSRRNLLLHEVNSLQIARKNLEARVQSLLAESSCKLRFQEDQLELATRRSKIVENDLETNRQILNNTYMKCEDMKSALSMCTDNEKLKKIQLNELEDSVTVLEKEIINLEKTQVDLTEDNYRRNSEIQNLKSEISSIRKTHEITKRTMNFSEKAASLETEVVPLRKSVQEHKESIDRLRSDLNGENVTQQQQRIVHLHQESEQLEAELADITNQKIPHRLSQIESTAAEVTAMTFELAEIQYQVTELQQKKSLLQENLKLSETKLQTVREAFCGAMNAATKDINLTKESSTSMPSLAFTAATADEMLHQMAKSIVIKENALSELSAQLLAEQAALSSTRKEIIEAEAEAAAMLSRERANCIRRKKASCISQKRDELSRAHQAELSQLRKTLTEGDIAFRQQLQKSQAVLRKRAEIHAQLEQRAAQLRAEHGKQMELLRVSSEGHHPLLDSSSDPFSNGLMNMMAQQFTNDSQVSASEGLALTPVDKWAVVLPDGLPHNAQNRDYSNQTALMEAEVDLFASQEDADILADQSQSSLVQATAAATAPSGGRAKTRPRDGSSRGRSGGRGESSQSPQRDDKDEARPSRRRKKSGKGGLDEQAAALSQQPRAGSQEADEGKGRPMARMRSSRTIGK